MFPPAANDAEADARFLAAFRSETGGAAVSFARFMALALYHPELGYYRCARERVGLSPRADFYTATSTGTVFGELVVAAVANLLHPAAARDHEFIEIGAEPGGGVLEGVAHPFRAARTCRFGEAPELTGDCVVFSNELFDAQPFHRLIRRGTEWRELGVALSGDRIVEQELPLLSRPIAAVVGDLPASAPDGYRLDLPLAATELCVQLAQAPWRGLFLAFDYGKTWDTLATDTPAGTARAYRSHRQVRDLLAGPGRQDLTCHVCWDWLERALVSAGFGAVRLESQESFLIRHAGEAAARIVQGAKPGPDPRRSRLHELLHPGLLGQRFQVLHAVRR